MASSQSDSSRLSFEDDRTVFKGSELEPNADGVYVSPAPAHKEGWTASFYRVQLRYWWTIQLKVTTAVSITPDTLPHAGIDLTQAPYEPGSEKVKVQTGK